MVLLKNLVLVASIAGLSQCTPYSKREADALPEAYAEASPESYLPFFEGSLIARNPKEVAKLPKLLKDTLNPQTNPTRHVNFAQHLGHMAQDVGNFMSEPHPFEGMGQALETCFKKQFEEETAKTRRDVSTFLGDVARRDVPNPSSVPPTQGSSKPPNSSNKHKGVMQHIGHIAQGVGNLLSKPHPFDNMGQLLETCVRQEVKDRAKARRDLSTFLGNIAGRDAPTQDPASVAPKSAPDFTTGSTPASAPLSASSSTSSPPPDPATLSLPSKPQGLSGFSSELHNITHGVGQFLSIPALSAAFEKFEPELQRAILTAIKGLKIIKRDAYPDPDPETYSHLYTRDADADAEPDPDAEIYDDIFARDAFAEPEPEAESDPEPYQADLLYPRDAEAYRMPSSFGLHGEGRPWRFLPHYPKHPPRPHPQPHHHHPWHPAAQDRGYHDFTFEGVY